MISEEEWYHEEWYLWKNVSTKNDICGRMISRRMISVEEWYHEEWYLWKNDIHERMTSRRLISVEEWCHEEWYLRKNDTTTKNAHSSWPPRFAGGPPKTPVASSLLTGCGPPKQQPLYDPPKPLPLSWLADWLSFFLNIPFFGIILRWGQGLLFSGAVRHTS